MEYSPKLNDSFDNTNKHNNDPRPFTAVINKRKIIRAKNTFFDSEKLYDETLSLKKQINNMKEENIKLKTRVYTLEKELSKSPILMSGQGGSNTVINLKQNIRSMRQIIRGKEEEIDKMRRSLKFTHQQEMEVITQSYIDENKRLKHMLEELMMKQFDGQTSVINTKKFEKEIKLKSLKKENQELLEILGNNERENQAMRIKLMELESKTVNTKKSKHKEELKKLKNTNQTLLQQIYDKDQKLQQLQDQMKQFEEEKINTVNSQNEKIMEFTEQLSKKNEQVESLIQQNESLQKSLAQFQQENTQMRQNLQIAKEQSQKNQIEYQNILLQLMQLQKNKSDFLSKSMKIKGVLQTLLNLKQKLLNERKEVQLYLEFFQQNVDDFKNKYCN